MADVMQGLVTEAKKNKFSSLAHSLSDDDVVSVWDNVSGFIEKQMTSQKGVHIPGLGTFSFSQKKLDVGNNKFILIQRPVFMLSEKFAQTHGLNATKHHTTGQIPVVQLNFSALAHESPFDRDTVEACVKEVLQALARSVAARRNVEFTFCGIGRLQIRDSKAKMKFYKEFVNSMDGSGRLVEALKDRPGTMDSVMSERSTPARPGTSTLILPRISNGGLALGPSEGAMPTIREEGLTAPGDQAAALAPGGPEPGVEPAVGGEEEGEERPPVQGPAGDLMPVDLDPAQDYDIGLRPSDEQQPEEVFDDDDGRFSTEPRPPPIGQRGPSRTAVPMAKASGVSFAEDLLPNTLSPKGLRGSPGGAGKTPPLPGRRSLSPIHLPHSATPRIGAGSLDQAPTAAAAAGDAMLDKRRSQSVDRMEALQMRPTPPPMAKGGQAGGPPPASPGASSSCGHKDAGQELCYLCHQRDRRNVPVSFTKERRLREQEEDRLLQQFQHMKDAEAMLQEQESQFMKRHDNQKMAAFNLGVADAINSKKNHRPIDFHPSYIFQKRPLTPPRFIKQNQYHSDLAEQVLTKEEGFKKRKADEEFLERLEQVQLAEDLAAQREQYLRDKAEQQDQYKRALSAQIRVRATLNADKHVPHLREGHRMGPLTLPRPKVIVPFAQTHSSSLQLGQSNTRRTVRFKPLTMPARVPDSSEPIFGKYDMTNESMLERRHRAHDLYKEQLQTVEQRKRDAILRRLGEQKEEETMLTRTKNELLDDRADRFERMYYTRKQLESDWAKARDVKKAREHEEQERSKSPGALLHEQCDKYERCGQCKRRVGNCGESNIWRESRYIPGSRLMV